MTTVYRMAGEDLLHFPGPNPGTPYTRCGLDAGEMTLENRPDHWAGVWCTACMRVGVPWPTVAVADEEHHHTPEQVQGYADLTLSLPVTLSPADLPNRVVVDANGAYWRDYGTHYSMCPVSNDNGPIEIVAVFIPGLLDRGPFCPECGATAVTFFDDGSVMCKGNGHRWTVAS